MEGKLIKREDGYYLFTDESYVNAIASDHKNWIEIHNGYKLSIKNCDEIERGYDLFELAHEACNITDPLRLDSQKYKQDPYFRIGFNKGFQKALEILGDKKFSEEDIINAMERVWYWHEDNQDKDCLYLHKLENKVIQSLQQPTEIEVQIEMIKEEYTLNQNGEGFEDQSYRTWKEVPKLDENGCLILKKK